jgi:hypothetical protein
MVKKEVKNYSKITLFTVINVFPQASGPLLLNQGEDRNPTIIQEELRGMQHATLPATRFFRWHPKKVKSVFSVYFSTTPFCFRLPVFCCLGYAPLVARWPLRDTLRSSTLRTEFGGFFPPHSSWYV